MTPLNCLRTCRLRSVMTVVTTVLAFGSGAGCVPVLSRVLVSAPNRFHPFPARVNPTALVERCWGVDEQFWVDVGPPAASLYVSILEPSAAGPLRGTILVLHGIRTTSRSMLGTASLLAEAGYRAVLVDLRGHGRSSGEWLTYGVQEAADLSQVLDALESRGLVSGPVGVYGISYGATTAIHLAGRDSRVAAVVAVAPFDALTTEAPHYYRTILPGSDWFVPDETFAAAIADAGRLADFDPGLASAALAVQSTAASVLILHGADDWLVPPSQSAAIEAAAPGHVQREVLPDLGHTSIWFDPASQVAGKTLAWFDEHLARRPNRISSPVPNP